MAAPELSLEGLTKLASKVEVIFNAFLNDKSSSNIYCGLKFAMELPVNVPQWLGWCDAHGINNTQQDILKKGLNTLGELHASSLLLKCH